MKWHRFREQRAVVLDLYIELRKRQHFISTFIIFIALSRILRVLAQNYRKY